MRTFDVDEFRDVGRRICHLPVSMFCDIVDGVFEKLSLKYEYRKRHV